MIRRITSVLSAFLPAFILRTVRKSTFPEKDFDLGEFFAGRTVAQAKFLAINGFNRSFRIDVTGFQNSGKITLHENFKFDDGEVDTKTWHFRKIAEGRYVANRDDLLQPVEATIRNGTLRYTYHLYLDPVQKKNVVRFKDRITMVNKHTLKNTAIVFKYGIPVGLVTGLFQKQV